MSNPSAIWAALAQPVSAVGSIPFVDFDGATIITDVSYFSYVGPNATPTDTQLRGQLTILNGIRTGYAAAAAAGNTSINKPAGRVYIAAGANGLTVTCNCCFASSIVLLQLETIDATLTYVVSAPSNGSFVVAGNANATGSVTVSFVIINGVTA